LLTIYFTDNLGINQKQKGQNKRMQSRLIRLSELVFLIIIIINKVQTKVTLNKVIAGALYNVAETL